MIDETGRKIGIFDRDKAITRAKAENKDLILVAPKGRPPVTKILDFGKWQYEQKKAATKQGQKNKTLTLKSLRLGVRIGPGDFAVRRLAAEKFLKKGHKVKVVLQFRGREMMHFDLGLAKMQEFTDALEEIAKLEDPPKKIGRQLTMVLAPKK